MKQQAGSLAGWAIDAAYGILKPLLFRLDAENAHELLAAQIERWQSTPPFLRALRAVCGGPERGTEVLGLHFRNPLGIAAGFDKNGRMIAFLAELGFGFVEVGTVTLRPQPGNPRPRMFRFPEAGALVNRLGFNNEGAAALVRRVESYKAGSADPVPVFVNIGKNATVPIEEASSDYLACYEVVGPVADAIVVNVSSPNTASLRDLQTAAHLTKILDVLRSARSRRGFNHPIILKIAPDLTDEQLAAIVEVSLSAADAITATNTTIDRTSLPEASGLQGGLSGRPLRERATGMMRRLRQLAGPDYPLIGVGGIFDAADARERIAAGANLIEAYTGFIYQGPMFASRIVDGLEPKRPHMKKERDYA
ncbi:MAG TPA: quinone-dependent dihydroorotate dehydrogenase [Thermoanaerobaculia bacterium]|nr:quinone-dependent dihydroorotate dehydrogenase [Thermoanaerobaculia bacterium]